MFSDRTSALFMCAMFRTLAGKKQNSKLNCGSKGGETAKRSVESQAVIKIPLSMLEISSHRLML